MYMLDTDICVYVMLTYWRNSTQFLPMISVFPRSRNTESSGLGDFECGAACKIRTSLEKKGKPIGNMDLLIAAHGQQCAIT